MMQKVVDIKCPGCGAPVTTNDTICKFCRRPVIISTFNSVYDMPMPEVNKYVGAYKEALIENPDNKNLNTSVGMCYLKLKLYDKAAEAFEKAIENNFDNSETFFYAAISLLRGKKAFVTPRKDIDKIEEYIQAALMIEPRGIYYCFWAYIKFDFFKRKYLITSPTYTDLLVMAKTAGYSAYDVKQLFAILGVECPQELQLT